MKKITITVPKKGYSEGKTAPVIDAEGYVGAACQAATERFIEALGGAGEETIKPEMFATEDNVERLNICDN